METTRWRFNSGGRKSVGAVLKTCGTAIVLVAENSPASRFGSRNAAFAMAETKKEPFAPLINQCGFKADFQKLFQEKYERTHMCLNFGAVCRVIVPAGILNACQMVFYSL